MKTLARGYLDLTLAQAAIGVNVVVAKHLLGMMSPFVLLSTRFAFSSLFLLCMVGFTGWKVVGDDHPTGRLTGKDWGLLWGQALTAGFLFNYFFIQGLRFTTATSAGIITSALPALIAIFALWFLGQRLTQRKQVAIALATLGIIILSWNDAAVENQGAGSLLGDLLVFISLIPEALYSILAALLGKRVQVLSAAFFTNLLTWLLLLPLGWIAARTTDFSAFTPQVWGLLVLGGFSTMTFYWLWVRGLQVIPASTAGLFGGVLPLSTTILALLFLGEGFSIYDAVGMVLVMLSIGVGTGRSH